MSDQLMVFELGEDSFGVEFEGVQKVAPVKNVIKVYEAPKYVYGLAPIRDAKIPIVDMKDILGIDIIEDIDPEEILVLVVEIAEGVEIALKVDSLTGMVYTKGELSKKKFSKVKYGEEFVLGVCDCVKDSDEFTVTVLDVKRALLKDLKLDQ